ncbi:MAG: zf-HC2 domain-containing protein [Proteobacteria bacterium]|nr:zf-HC2 domain-containing protein [Pseudomonadota bacterium]
MRFKLTCKDVHRLTSEGLDRELSLIERTRLRAHIMLCDACYHFTGQMQLLRRAMRKLDTQGGNANAPVKKPVEE